MPQRITNPRATAFIAGKDGHWKIQSVSHVKGDLLPMAEGLDRVPADAVQSATQTWCLLGVASSVRYVERAEQTELQARQEGLGRALANRAALIPIKKSESWWSKTQEERRAIFEEQSHHISQSLAYLPAIARQLYHSRDLEHVPI